MSDQKKSGCLKYFACGCIAFIILVILGIVAAFFFTKAVVSGMADKYTDSAPRLLPAPQTNQQEVDDVLGRVSQFSDAIGKGNPAPELVLSSKDINILMNKHPLLSKAAGKISVNIDGDRINGDLSIPLEEFTGMFKGRHLNGSAALRIGMSSGRLTVFADSIEVKGEKVPESFMNSFRAQNLAEKANTDPNIAPVLQKIDSITVKDGSIHVVPKNRQ